MENRLRRAILWLAVEWEIQKSLNWRYILLFMTRRHMSTMGAMASAFLILSTAARAMDKGDWDIGATMVTIVWGWTFFQFLYSRRPRWSSTIDETVYIVEHDKHLSPEVREDMIGRLRALQEGFRSRLDR